jgi:hypothetical protein
MKLGGTLLVLGATLMALAAVSVADSASAQGVYNVDPVTGRTRNRGRIGGGRLIITGLAAQQARRAAPQVRQGSGFSINNTGGTAVLEGTTPALKRRPNSVSAQPANARGNTGHSFGAHLHRMPTMRGGIRGRR